MLPSKTVHDRQITYYLQFTAQILCEICFMTMGVKWQLNLLPANYRLSIIYDFHKLNAVAFFFVKLHL